MEKIKFYVLFSIMALFLSISTVKASDDGFINVLDEAGFDECIRVQSACRLMSDLNLTAGKSIYKEVVIDLNGYTITPSDSLKLTSGLISVNRGGKLTINDSKKTGKISTGTSDNVWAAIQVIKDNSGTLPAELIINGGTIEGYYYGITGNGNNHNSKIIINGGTINGVNKEDSAAIYHPQNGELIINNGTIKGGTGIEIRSGDLTVNDGTIEAVATKFIKMVNKNGTTTNGVGIAVAQHTTKNAIKVVVNGGNIQGQYAFYEWNPHNNSQDDLNKISIQLKGGNYTGLATGVHAVYSEDFKNFISGGKYNTSVSEYLTEDAKLAASISNGNIIMNEESNNNVFPKIITLTILLLGVVFSIFFCKKKKILIFN